MKLLFFIFAFFLVLVAFSNAVPSLDNCYVQSNSCNAGDIAVLRISDLSNAHAELLSASQTYSNILCCSGSGLINTNNPAHSYNIFNLSSPTDAHVAYDASYTQNPVYLGTFDNNYGVYCSYKTGQTCDAAEKCVITVTSPNNAHVASCSSPMAYPTKVCCQVSSGPPPEQQCNLLSAYWAKDSAGNEKYANNAEEKYDQLVYLITKGQSCSGGIMEFKIYKTDCTYSQITLSNGIPSCSGVNLAVKETHRRNINSNTIVDNWYTEYDASYPGYVFVAKIEGSSTAILSDGRLIVINEPSPCLGCPPSGGGNPNCGNGVLDSGESCDPLAPSGSLGTCPSGLICSSSCNACLYTSGNMDQYTIKSECKEDTNPNDQYGIYTETVITYDKTTGAVISREQRPEKQCLLKGKVKVPGFGWINFFVVIALITTYYLVQHRKTRSKH
ncbi:MAG: hypothetical protein AABW41_00790 [Nanoarchaeota archaeon]